MFLYLVESGLRGGDTRFAHGTFRFVQVCRRWCEVAVGCPRIWSLWVAGAVKAWPLFKSRSKDAPLSLTWRPQLPDSERWALMDPAIPRRTHRLDFSGTSDQLAHFLGIFDSGPPSGASSIRLQITEYDDREPREKFARLLSSPFSKLSKLNVGNFLPDPSSPIFTTSKLTSLKLFLPYHVKGRHTLAQFSQILQRHPNLEELDLNIGAIPLPETPETAVTFALPRLVSLRLYGTKGAILGFVDFIGMSSPLHDVVIHFDYTPGFTIPALASAMEKIVTAYYNCQGLGYPRKIDTLTISSHEDTSHLTFDARSRSAHTSNLEIQFGWTWALGHGAVMEETFGLLPSDDVQEFTIDGLLLTRRMLQKMRGLSHLRLYNQGRRGIRQALDALSPGDRGASAKCTTRTLIRVHKIDELHQYSVPKLESLSVSLPEAFDDRTPLLAVLKERRDHDLGLRELVFRSCPADWDKDILLGFREIVGVRLDSGAVADPGDDLDDKGVGEGEGSEKVYNFYDDDDVCEDYDEYTRSD